MNTVMYFIKILAAAFYPISSSGKSYMPDEPSVKGPAPEISQVLFIHSIGMVDIQPQESDKAVIWYDDFNHEKTYMVSSGEIDYNELCGQSRGRWHQPFNGG